MSKMPIIIQFLDGKRSTLEVLKKGKIIDIKKQLQEKEGLAPKGQRLLYEGLILEDDKKIADYQIVNNSVINVIVLIREEIRIFVKTVCGKLLPLNMHIDERIINMKRMIHEEIGLSPRKQKLILNGAVLDDDKTIGFYQINEMSIINVVERLDSVQTVQLFAETIYGERIRLEVTTSDKIGYLKELIKIDMKRSNDIHELFFDTKPLEDDKTIDYYEICGGSVINVTMRNIVRVYIRIQEKTEDTLVIDKHEEILSLKEIINEKILSLKEIINEEMISLPYKQILMFNETELADDKTIDYYEIVDGSIIDVTLRYELKIFAETVDGKKIELTVALSDRIVAIKQNLKDHINIPPDRQKIQYNGKILQDFKTIGYYSILENSVIKVLDELMPFQIFIQELNGSKMGLKVTCVDLIKTIKENIRTEQGLPANEQVLIRGRTILCNDKVLKEYQIQEWDTINVIPIWQTVVIVIIFPNGKKSVLESKLVKTVQDLKKSIEKKTGNRKESLKLTFNGKILDDTDFIGICGLSHKSVVVVI